MSENTLKIGDKVKYANKIATVVDMAKPFGGYPAVVIEYKGIFADFGADWQQIDRLSILELELQKIADPAGERTLNTYAVEIYNTITGSYVTESVEAESADQAIALATKRSLFSFTRKNQNSTDEAVRDNAHAQFCYRGTKGACAYRAGMRMQYSE